MLQSLIRIRHALSAPFPLSLCFQESNTLLTVIESSLLLSFASTHLCVVISICRFSFLNPVQMLINVELGFKPKTSCIVSRILCRASNFCYYSCLIEVLYSLINSKSARLFCSCCVSEDFLCVTVYCENGISKS